MHYIHLKQLGSDNQCIIEIFVRQSTVGPEVTFSKNDHTQDYLRTIASQLENKS